MVLYEIEVLHLWIKILKNTFELCLYSNVSIINISNISREGHTQKGSRKTKLMFIFYYIYPTQKQASYQCHTVCSHVAWKKTKSSLVSSCHKLLEQTGNLHMKKNNFVIVMNQVLISVCTVNQIDLFRWLQYTISDTCLFV